jgi:hypothetical protein
LCPAKATEAEAGLQARAAEGNAGPAWFPAHPQAKQSVDLFRGQRLEFQPLGAPEFGEGRRFG